MLELNLVDVRDAGHWPGQHLDFACGCAATVSREGRGHTLIRMVPGHGHEAFSGFIGQRACDPPICDACGEPERVLVCCADCPLRICELCAIGEELRCPACSRRAACLEAAYLLSGATVGHTRLPRIGEPEP